MSSAESSDEGSIFSEEENENYEGKEDVYEPETPGPTHHEKKDGTGDAEDDATLQELQEIQSGIHSIGSHQTDTQTQLTNERSQFTTDIGNALDLLRKACTSNINKVFAGKALNTVEKLCKIRFQAKSRLGNSGAAEHLYFLLERWRDYHLVVHNCRVLSEFMTNETENKILLGYYGLPQLTISILKQHESHMQVIKACCKLMIDMSNSLIQGLLTTYLNKKSPKEKKEGNPLLQQTNSQIFNNVLIEDPMIRIDNRKLLGEHGACELLIHLLVTVTSHTTTTHHIENVDEIITCIINTIATLANNDYNAKKFGENGICACLTGILKVKHHTQRVLSTLYAVIILCSDAQTGNKERFYECDGCHVIIDLLHEIMRNPGSLSKQKEFNKYCEYLCWALLNLIIHSESNRNAIKQIPYAYAVVDNLVSEDEIPSSAKKKLLTIKNIAFNQRQSFIDSEMKFSEEDKKAVYHIMEAKNMVLDHRYVIDSHRSRSNSNSPSPTTATMPTMTSMFPNSVEEEKFSHK